MKASVGGILYKMPKCRYKYKGKSAVNEAMYHLIGLMSSDDWDTVYRARFSLHHLGEAIVNTAKRECKPLKAVAKMYHHTYFRKK